MSFARWDNLEACSTEQMQIGHSETDANKICMGIKERADKGILYKSLPTLEILKSQDDELIVGGPASWECEDYEHDIVTTEAQVNFLTKFFSLPAEYRNISIDHSNFQIAVAIPKWPEEDPKHFSHVHEKGMYLIGKVRSDSLAHSRHYRKLIREGVYKMYSISGKPIRHETVMLENKHLVRKIYDIDPVEVGIVKEGMNQKAGPLELLKQKEDLQKPFANYESWEACMTDCQTNHPDVTDCKAWCGRIKHETEAKTKLITKTFEEHDDMVRHAVAKGQSLPFRQEAERIFRKHFPEYHGEST